MKIQILSYKYNYSNTIFCHILAGCINNCNRYPLKKLITHPICICRLLLQETPWPNVSMVLCLIGLYSRSIRHCQLRNMTQTMRVIPLECWTSLVSRILAKTVLSSSVSTTPMNTYSTTSTSTFSNLNRSGLCSPAFFVCLFVYCLG